MADRIERKHPRIEINQTIKVTDVINGGDFGELVNVTIEGIMLITKREIAVNSIYQFSMALPFELEGINTLTLGANCLWCSDLANIRRFWTGFQIIDPSDIARAQIDQLITHYAP